MATTKGSDWKILIGGTTIADKIECQTSASLEITQDSIEITCKDTDWKTYLSGEKGWTMPFEVIKDETAASVQSEIMTNVLGTGVEVDVAIVYAPAGAIASGWKGKAIITSYSMSFPKNEAPTASGTLQGSGALTVMTGV